MAAEIIVNGIILSGMPIGEADKRVVILTKEMGRMSAFVRGAKRMTSPLGARTRTFAFGQFTLSPGRNAYTVARAEISEYFEDIVKDVEKTAFGCYFLELAQDFARENTDESELTELAYRTLKALSDERIAHQLTRRVFELKLLQMNGLSPDLSVCCVCRKPLVEGRFKPSLMQAVCTDCEPEDKGFYLSRSALYAYNFIRTTRLQSLYTFAVRDDVLSQLSYVSDRILMHVWDREPESRKMLEVLIN